MALTDTQLERYARHILLREIGGVGQQKLLAAKVLVIGAGGLGAPSLLYLAAAGVGTIGIVDDDVVSLSNLQRQVLFATAEIGRPKVEAAAARLGALNPDVRIETYRTRLTPANAEELIGPYDLVLDGCDNFETRFAANDACVRLGRTLVSGAIGEFDGQIAVFQPQRRDAKGERLPCYRCFVPEPPEGAATCTEQGVVGALAGVIGTWTALEVVKEITGFGESLGGRLVLFDGLSAETRKVRLRRDPECPACGGLP
ncbi:MAG: molybdopterin-synthase adenylyltransferase MoeB [Alphaproteobacteria bacterium]|nr:molybdopterin-synthase adenylyltransferase MoeB [Alphaproteobacteria bacterium]